MSRLSPGSGPAANVELLGGAVPEPSTVVIGGIALATLGCQVAFRSLRQTRAKSRRPRD